MLRIEGLAGFLVAGSAESREQAIERYWRDYLSDNGRKLFRAAALLEDHQGPGYTLEDIARSLSITYESVRSFKQTNGRVERKWREDTDTEPPIRLEWDAYRSEGGDSGMRTVYHLPEGVADAVRVIASS
jgi:hypothetical protein